MARYRTIALKESVLLVSHRGFHLRHVSCRPLVTLNDYEHESAPAALWQLSDGTEVRDVLRIPCFVR